MKKSKNTTLENIDFIVSEVKCGNCKHVFSTWARQLSLLDDGDDICPICAKSRKEGKFTLIKKSF